jgi:hypothetical protein
MLLNREKAVASDPGETGQRPGEADDEAALEMAMREVPRGAIAVAGTAVALLMICWFAIYLFVFLPRGSVG